MAEIILPPEEEQEETPQVPELNIDKPTENSKVITIEFEAKKTNKVSTKDTNQQLYTTDTDAWFEFKETSLESANGTYSVVFRNRHDGSIFQRTGDVVNGVAYYKIPHQEIRHAGAWRGQIVYTLSNGDTTSREFGYDVKGHMLDGKDVREIIVEDFETLMSQLRNMKDNAELELANLTQELKNTAEQNEADRQTFFDDLVEDIDDLQAHYQELLDTGVLQTNINTKLEALEEEYAPKLTEVTAQLAQSKIEIQNKRDKSVKIEPEDASEDFLNLVTGNGEINLESVPQDFSVTPQKMAYFVGLNMYPFHKKAVIHADGEFAKEIAEAIKDIKLYGADDTTNYRIRQINREYYASSIDDYEWSVRIFNSFDEEVCRFLKMGDYEEPDGLTKLTLSERNSSGITGVVLMDWTKLPEGMLVTGLTYEETGLDESTYSGDTHNLSMTLTEENEDWSVE